MKMSSSSIFLKLRRYNKKNYKQLLFCTFFSIFLVTSFVCVLYSPVVQAGFPEGGDSLKMIMMIFALAVLGCLIFNIYAAGLFFRTKSRETGVFLALGMTKKRLKKELYKELFLSLGKGIRDRAWSCSVSWNYMGPASHVSEGYSGAEDVFGCGTWYQSFLCGDDSDHLIFYGGALYEADKSDGYFK